MKISAKYFIGIAIGVAVLGIAAYGFATSSGRVDRVPATANVLAVRVPPLVPKNIPVLVYHSIAPVPAHREGPLQKRYRITPENFDAQMKYLADNGYTPIRFDVLADYLLHDSEIPEKPVVLTFDDGLLNQYEHAFPVLQKYKFPGTFFVYPGVTNHRGFMTREQIVSLHQTGHEIGAHSMIHENLPKVPPEKISYEIVISKQKLETMIGAPVTTMAYPHYAENELVRTMVAESGYVAARAGWRDVQNSASEIFRLKAQEAVNGTNPFSMK